MYVYAVLHMCDSVCACEQFALTCGLHTHVHTCTMHVCMSIYTYNTQAHPTYIRMYVYAYPCVSVVCVYVMCVCVCVHFTRTYIRKSYVLACNVNPTYWHVTLHTYTRIYVHIHTYVCV
jgi:hypothetical protein